MSAITKQARAPYIFEDRKEFIDIVPFFNGYNTSADNADKILYLSDFNNSAAIATGTVGESTDQPVLARKYENNGSIYKFDSDQRPASVIDTVGKQVTVASANDGYTFDGITFNVDPNGFVMFTAKESAGNPTFTLRTSSGNERDFAFTATGFEAVSNGYKRYIAPVAPGTYTNVTVSDTGTFDPATITEVDVIGSAAGTIDWNSLHAANNVDCFIGSHKSLPFNCLDEYTWNRTLDTADQKCSNYTTGTTVTNKALEIDLKYNDLNFAIEAASMGETVKRGSTLRPTIINAEAGGNNNQTVSAGTMTIAGLTVEQIALVTIDGVPLTRIESVSAVNETSYHYAEGTGTFTFSTLYNGKTPFIVYQQTTTGNFFDDKNLKTGFTGNLMVTRRSANGVTMTWEFQLAEIVSVTPEQGDAQVTHTVKLKVYPFRVGNEYRFYRQTKY